MADVIDISIKQVKKVVKKKEDYIKFLESDLKLFEKTDGVKVTLFLKPDAKVGQSVDENWIVGYKGNVLTSGEFEHNDDTEAKNSVGSSQFKFIFDTLKQINVDNLSKGYQFFCEYLINKPTLMSQYNKLYNLILLAYSKSDCVVKNGLMKCNNTNFEFDEKERETLATMLGIYAPPLVFEGKLYPYSELKKGVKYSELEKQIEANENEFLNAESDPELYYKVLVNTFLGTESVFGGSPEGYVVYGYSKDPLKFQQEYQLSKEERAKIKAQFRDDSDLKEAFYWKEVGKVAQQIIDDLHLLETQHKLDLRKPLAKISKYVRDLPEGFIKHSKKNWATIKDDIVLSAKMLLIRGLADRFCLIPGKFRIFTKKHKELVEKALKKFDGVVINIVNERKTPKELKALKKTIIEGCFKDLIKAGKIEVQESQTGNLATLIAKTSSEIFGIYAGTDRADEYRNYFEKSKRDIHVIELQRDESSISASKVITNIEDEKYFKENTPKCEWKYYKDLKKFYQLS